MLSGFESTGWGRRRHSPVRDSHRAQPGRPRLHSASRLTLETAGARATSRFGLLAPDCATEHADIFPAVFFFCQQCKISSRPSSGLCSVGTLDTVTMLMVKIVLGRRMLIQTGGFYAKYRLDPAEEAYLKARNIFCLG